MHSRFGANCRRTSSDCAFKPGETAGAGEEKPRRTEINDTAIAMLATNGDGVNHCEVAGAKTPVVHETFTLLELETFKIVD